MAKKKEATPPMIYVAMIAIVAIVAGVVLVLNWNSVGNAGGEAVAGEAIAKQCPVVLKDYEIHAYAITGSPNGDFEVNGERFVLTPGPIRNLANGTRISLDNSLIQAFAGGLAGVNFDFQGCSSDYNIEAYRDGSVNGDGSVNRDALFTVVSVSPKLKPFSQEETFNLNVGESKILRDGSKIILRSAIKQENAGGLNGAVFELICRS